MKKFRDILLQETYDDLIEQGFDPDFAYESVSDIEDVLDHPFKMDIEKFLDTTDKMQEEDATNSD